MPADEAHLLERVVATLSRVPGVAAVALGGSRAQGTATPESDYDIGVYYLGEAPFAHDALQAAASELGDPGADPTVTAIGAWGPWIDGGGWLTVDRCRVDLLYGDVRRVERVIEECRAGTIEVAYQPGHPHAFISSILMGQAALCRPLWDPNGSLERLKEAAQSYPEALRDTLVRRFGWEADFALQNADKGLKRGDSTYVIGCCYRSLSCCLQILFALNRRYLLNEKGAVALAGGLALQVASLPAFVDDAFGGAEPASAVSVMRRLVGEVGALAKGEGFRI